MPTVFTRLVLFASSFAPLFIVFGVLQSFGGGFAAWICYGIAVGSLLGLFGFLRVARRLAPIHATIADVSRRDADTIAYVVTYLIPFLGVDTDSWRGRIAVGIFLAVIAVLYIRSELFYVNPVLTAAGFNLYEAEVADRRVIIITRRSFLRGTTQLSLRRLGSDIFLE